MKTKGRATNLSKLPLVTDYLELFATTQEGIALWKPKAAQITCENLLTDIFTLSSEIAAYFEIRHDHLCGQNISKLQLENHLPQRLPNFREPYLSGNKTQRYREIYALTRHETEYLIMDLSGTKARSKKFSILKRLHAIEADVLKGAYAEARKKAQEFDGVQLLDEFGFICSAGDKLATKKDIADFLKIPESTVNSFLRKHRNEIKPVQLGREAIRKLGSRANRMNAYHLDDVLKICFWMQSEVGVNLKRRLLGNSSVLLQNEDRKEMEWRVILAKIFAGFDLRYNYSVGCYKVDFVVRDLLLCMELDENHDSYDLSVEDEREKFIARHYTLIRFRNETSLEVLVNAILKAQIKQVVRLYR